jgi:NADPH-dependent glutamate synthase beta subunit-like oxidoreductase
VSLGGLSAESEGRNVLMVGGGNVAMDVTCSAAREVLRQHGPRVEELAPSDKVAAVGSNDDQKAVSYSRFYRTGYFNFESPWLVRRLENENWID